MPFIAGSAPDVAARQAAARLTSGLGQQFVAYAIHPATGRPYDWPEEQLADIDLERLPIITEEQARAVLAEAAT